MGGYYYMLSQFALNKLIFYLLARVRDFQLFYLYLYQVG